MSPTSPDLCYIDRSIKSKNHLNTIKYIRKWILKPSDKLSTITIPQFVERLKTYRTQNTNKALSYGSIKCLFYTMQKERSATWDWNEMREAKNKFWVKRTAFDTLRSNDNLYDSEMTERIRTAIMYFARVLFGREYASAEVVFVARCVIITVATNLRISEILQLTKKHLQQILDNEIINIRIKKKKTGVKLLSHDWLLKAMLKQLAHQGDEYKLVQVSKSFINKTIRVHMGDVPQNMKFGIHSIRKVNTTLLIEHGDLKIAQLFNRHNKKDVTRQYYNNKTYIAPTINSIMKQQHAQ
nr:VLF-1 [Menippe mercenaria nudivirus]